jgi:adenosyl cobinamide kinase/adenosyl cobinamide phosphate guanylyltransferase
MNLCNREAEASQAVLQSIASKLREIVQDEGHADTDFVTRTSTVSRLLRGVDHKVSTLVGVANELGYDVVVHFRERPSPLRRENAA